MKCEITSLRCIMTVVETHFQVMLTIVLYDNSAGIGYDKTILCTCEALCGGRGGQGLILN